MTTKHKSDSTEHIDFNESENKPPAKRGNPNWTKGQKSPNPVGRPKKGQEKTTLLFNELKKNKLDVVKELALIINSGNLPDKARGELLSKFLPYLYPALKSTDTNITKQVAKYEFKFADDDTEIYIGGTNAGDE